MPRTGDRRGLGAGGGSGRSRRRQRQPAGVSRRGHHPRDERHARAHQRGGGAAVQRRGARDHDQRRYRAHHRASKTDQLGGRRYALHRAGHARRDHAAGPLFRRVLRGGHGSSEPLGADGIRGIVRKRVAAVPGSGGRVGGHSFRVGRAAAGRAGGARLDTPEVYIRLKAARGPVARGAATGWAGSNTLYRAGLPAIGSGKVPTRMYRSPLPG